MDDPASQKGARGRFLIDAAGASRPARLPAPSNLEALLPQAAERTVEVF